MLSLVAIFVNTSLLLFKPYSLFRYFFVTLLIEIMSNLMFTYRHAMVHTDFFFWGGDQGKNITHFTINKIMQILNIF
jgi:hypothetical protein